MGDRVDTTLRRYLQREGMTMPAPVNKDECKETHKDLEKDIEAAIATAMASVESRIKIWILTAALTTLAAVIYIIIGLAASQEKVETNQRDIQRLERCVDQMQEWCLGRGLTGTRRQP